MRAPGVDWICSCGARNDALRTVCYRGCKPPLREAVNVSDELARDRIVRRIQQSRANAIEEKKRIEYYNSLHPECTPLDSSWCDEVVAWCDGKGPLPRGFYE